MQAYLSTPTKLHVFHASIINIIHQLQLLQLLTSLGIPFTSSVSRMHALPAVLVTRLGIAHQPFSHVLF